MKITLNIKSNIWFKKHSIKVVINKIESEQDINQAIIALDQLRHQKHFKSIIKKHQNETH